MKIEEFISYLKKQRHYSNLTISSYKSDLLQFEKFLSQDNPEYLLQKDDSIIDSKCIRAWIMTLSENNIETRSINRKISSLRAYFKWIEINNINFVNPMEKIINPKTPKRKILAMTEDDTEKLFSIKPNEEDFNEMRNYLILELLYSTGMRQAELLSLKETDINYNKDYLNVIGKGNKERIIPIGKKIITDLTKYIDFKRRLNISETALMVNKDGRKLSKYQLYSIVHKKLENYDVSEKSPHEFRHTCATHLVKEGADIINVKNLLGHTSLSATEVYINTTIEELKKEYKRSFEHKLNN